MTSGEHTKGADLPLMLDGDVIVAPVVGVVARIPNHPENAKNWQEYANLIVTAVNTYPAVAELVESLEKIATGQIVGEPRNHKDTLSIVQDIAKDALTRFREAQAGGQR